jgi:hypothetical protein
MWLRATRFGLVDSAFTPFWEMHVGSFFTVRDWEGGGFEVTNMNIIFYTDPVSGKFLETFRNPITGKNVAVRYPPPRIGKRHFNISGEIRDPMTRPGMDIKSSMNIGPAWAEGDNVWVRADTSSRMTPTDSAKGRLSQVNDWSTYAGSVKSVTDPDAKNPPSMWIFNDTNTWAEWLEMGDRPGNYVSRGIGHKAYSMDEMPKTWRVLVKQRFPQIAADPAGALHG